VEVFQKAARVARRGMIVVREIPAEPPFNNSATPQV
jgi:hypothetical protein